MPTTDAEDLFYRGIDFFAEGKFEEAITAYQKALEIDPTFADALHGLARACFEKGDYERAIQYAKRIAELDPDAALAHTNLSICYQKMDRIKEAEEEAAKAKVLGWKQQLSK